MGCGLLAYGLTNSPGPVKVKSCACGAHWWIKRWGIFWRHLDASPFNDWLQDRWTIWLFEFRDVLVLTELDQEEMGYANGPVREDGTPLWARSKWQLKPKATSYCLRCVRRTAEQKLF